MISKLNFDGFPAAAIPAAFILAALLLPAAPAEAQTTTPTATIERPSDQPRVLLASDEGDNLEATPPTTAGGFDESSFIISIRNFNPRSIDRLLIQVLLSYPNNPERSPGVETDITSIPGLITPSLVQDAARMPEAAARMQSTDYDFTVGAAPQTTSFLLNRFPSDSSFWIYVPSFSSSNNADITIHVSARETARALTTRIEIAHIGRRSSFVLDGRTPRPPFTQNIASQDISGLAEFEVIAANGRVAQLLLTEEDGEVIEGEMAVTGFTLTLDNAPQPFNHARVTYTLAGDATLDTDYRAEFRLGSGAAEALTMGTGQTLQIPVANFTGGTANIPVVMDAINDGVGAARENEEIILTITEVEYFSDTAGNNSLGTAELFGASVTLSITEPRTDPAFGDASIGEQTWVVGEEINPAVILPVATSGDGDLRYTLTPDLAAAVGGITVALPSGRTTPGSISGAPEAELSQTVYTLRATDIDNENSSDNTRAFLVTVTSGTTPSFDGAMIDDQTWMVGEEINPMVTLPAATDGDGDLTYTLTPTNLAADTGITVTLPSGRTTPGSISGTPATPLPETQFTLTVADEDEDSAILEFFITITNPALPTFGVETIAEQIWVVDDPISPVILPVAMSGIGRLNYNLTPSNLAAVAGITVTLPVGRDTPGSISGTPTERLRRMQFTLTATDDNSNPAALGFYAEIVSGVTFGTKTIKDQMWVVGVPITPTVTLPFAAGGRGSLLYRIIPTNLADDSGITVALPSGRTTSGSISGTPTAQLRRTEFVLVAVDESDNLEEIINPSLFGPTFSVTITSGTAPSFNTETIDEQVWAVGVPISSAVILPFATSGDGALTYALAPSDLDADTGITVALPSGRNNIGTITGTPAASLLRTEFTLSAADMDDDAAFLTFFATITSGTVPTFGAATIEDQTWEGGVPIPSPVILPVATGGDGDLNYTLTIPGINLQREHPSIRVTLPVGRDTPGSITGTPDDSLGVEVETEEWTLTATDEDNESATLSFRVSIESDGIGSSDGLRVRIRVFLEGPLRN